MDKYQTNRWETTTYIKNLLALRFNSDLEYKKSICNFILEMLFNYFLVLC